MAAIFYDEKTERIIRALTPTIAIAVTFAIGVCIYVIHRCTVLEIHHRLLLLCFHLWENAPPFHLWQMVFFPFCFWKKERTKICCKDLRRVGRLLILWTWRLRSPEASNNPIAYLKKYITGGIQMRIDAYIALRRNSFFLNEEELNVSHAETGLLVMTATAIILTLALGKNSSRMLCGSPPQTMVQWGPSAICCRTYKGRAGSCFRMPIHEIF